MAPRVTISQELFDHLKQQDGTISKNLDKIILGKTTDAAPTRTKKRKFPESEILYSAILDTFDNTYQPKTRQEILEHVNNSLAKTDVPKKYPSWYNYETNTSWRSRFSTTIDNRLLTLVRSKQLRRVDGNFYIYQAKDKNF